MQRCGKELLDGGSFFREGGEELDKLKLVHRTTLMKAGGKGMERKDVERGGRAEQWAFGRGESRKYAGAAVLLYKNCYICMAKYGRSVLRPIAACGKAPRQQSAAPATKP